MLVLKLYIIEHMKQIIKVGLWVAVTLTSSSTALAQNQSNATDTLSNEVGNDTVTLESNHRPEGEMTLKDSIKYSAAYQFKDGFYIGRKAFLQNHPVTIDSIVTAIPFTDPNFYGKVLHTGGFESLNPDGTFKYHSVHEVFGFVQNRIFYMNMGPYGFVRLTNFGRICYIAKDDSPPRVQPVGGVGVNSWGGVGVGVGVQVNGGSVINEYIFRIDGGPIVDFTPEMLLQMMRDDEILFNAYAALNKRFRLKEMRNYLQEFNRRNPLYLPN